MNEAVEFAQNIVGDVAAGARLAVQKDGDLRVAVADLAHKGTKLGNRFFLFVGEFFVVDRQNEGRTTALLLGE